MKAHEFDEKFDRGEDTISELDVAKAHGPGEAQRRVNVDFPAWMIAASVFRGLADAAEGNSRRLDWVTSGADIDTDDE